MPKTTLENPFKPKKPLKDDDIKLVREVLGNEEADEMARLTGDQKQKTVEPEEPIKLDDPGLSDEQREALENLPWTRYQVIQWAKEIGKDTKWVDETFKFHKNGEITVEGEFDLEDKNLDNFPVGISEINCKKVRLNGLKTVKHLGVFSNSVEYISLDNITTTEGLVIPDSVQDLWLNGLTSIKGLDIPIHVKTLSLDGLTSAEGLVVPDSVDFLSLNGLTSANGLNVTGAVVYLYLGSITTIEGLKLPDSCEYLFAEKLPDSEIEKFKEKYPKHANTIQ